MTREQITSSMIASIGYDDTRGILEIEFQKSGAIWNYADVPENIYYDFKRSDSHGKYFLSHIKGQYRENRVR